MFAHTDTPHNDRTNCTLSRSCGLTTLSRCCLRESGGRGAPSGPRPPASPLPMSAPEAWPRIPKAPDKPPTAECRNVAETTPSSDKPWQKAWFGRSVLTTSSHRPVGTENIPRAWFAVTGKLTNYARLHENFSGQASSGNFCARPNEPSWPLTAGLRSYPAHLGFWLCLLRDGAALRHLGRILGRLQVTTSQDAIQTSKNNL